MGVDSYGNTRELYLNIPRSAGSSDKLRLEHRKQKKMRYIA